VTLFLIELGLAVAGDYKAMKKFVSRKNRRASEPRQHPNPPSRFDKDDVLPQFLLLVGTAPFAEPLPLS
jgi:hypothetical protein